MRKFMARHRWRKAIRAVRFSLLSDCFWKPKYRQIVFWKPSADGQMLTQIWNIFQVRMQVRVKAAFALPGEGEFCWNRPWLQCSSNSPPISHGQNIFVLSTVTQNCDTLLWHTLLWHKTVTHKTVTHVIHNTMQLQWKTRFEWNLSNVWVWASMKQETNPSRKTINPHPTILDVVGLT